ncbi:hypothetical protein ACFV3E_46535 [Streptomyces sp. NPDC059718]
MTFTDKSNNEGAFQLERRSDPNSSNLTLLPSFLRTQSETSTGSKYTFTDTIPSGTNACYEVLVWDEFVSYDDLSNDVCTTPLPTLPQPTDGAGAASFVVSNTSTGGAGANNPITIGSDNRGIAPYYLNGELGGSRDLAVAHCDDIECTTVHTHTIDTAGDVGRYASLRIGSDGLPLISYVTDTNSSGGLLRTLKVAHCTDVTCSSAAVSTVDGNGTNNFVGGQTALAIAPDGRGSIAYVNGDADPNTPDKLKMAHCANVACTSSTTTVIDPDIGVPNSDQGQVSMATSPNGVIYISYSDGSINTGPADLKVIGCNSNCSSFFARVTVDQTGDSGQSSSLTIGRDGLPLISYRHSGAGNVDLMVGHCQNVYCSWITRNTIDQVGLDPVGSARPLHSSIAIGADGLGIISYYDWAGANLKVAHCGDLVCSSATSIKAVDEFGDVGRFNSITVGTDGLPLIAYRDISNNAVKTIHCADYACQKDLGTIFRK